MRRLNNSQPLAVTTTFAPLNTTMKIVALDGMTTVQFYKQTLNEWIPNHQGQPVFDANGAQKDGVLRLHAVYSVNDNEGLVETNLITPWVYWFVDGTQITSIDSTEDYYIVGDDLYVRKNFTHLNGVTVTCEVRFTDPRTSLPVVLSDTHSLHGVMQADEQWAINILCDRTRKHYPLTAATTIYDFEAEARLGSADKSNNVAWFWDYSTDNGATWNTIGDDCYWYVSGKNSKILRIDMDYIESILVRCRIGVGSGTSTAAPDIPNEATASMAWRFPKIRPQVFSYGGDRVFVDTVSMRFGVFVHVPGHDDMTDAQKREWLLANWAVRKQGSSDAPVLLGEPRMEVDIPRQYIFSFGSEKFIPDPQLGLRGHYDVVADSDGELIETSAGLFAIRV